MNMEIWVVGTLNQLKQSFRKNKVVTGKTALFRIGSFCTPHSVCLNIGF